MVFKVLLIFFSGHCKSGFKQSINVSIRNQFHNLPNGLNTCTCYHFFWCDANVKHIIRANQHMRLQYLSSHVLIWCLDKLGDTNSTQTRHFISLFSNVICHFRLKFFDICERAGPNLKEHWEKFSGALLEMNIYLGTDLYLKWKKWFCFGAA